MGHYDDQYEEQELEWRRKRVIEKTPIIHQLKQLVDSLRNLRAKDRMRDDHTKAWEHAEESLFWLARRED